MKRILITGPEATGKSALCHALANHFEAQWVREAARNYLLQSGGKYARADLDAILELQLKAEADAGKEGGKVLFCDTGPEVLYIWSEFKYGIVSQAINKAVEEMNYSGILVLYPDLPWEADPLRETPDSTVREALFSRYLDLLTHFNKPYREVRGVGNARTQEAIAFVEHLLSN